MCLCSYAPGALSSGDVSAVREPEAVVPQPLARFPQQLLVQPQGKKKPQNSTTTFIYGLVFFFSVIVELYVNAE